MTKKPTGAFKVRSSEDQSGIVMIPKIDIITDIVSELLSDYYFYRYSPKDICKVCVFTVI